MKNDDSLNTNAVLDALYIIEKLTDRYGDAAASEVHLFSYLSCLLALYDGKGADFWEYVFIVGAVHNPYAGTIDRAIELLLANSFVSVADGETDSFICLTEEGKDELIGLSSLGIYQPRLVYLKTACETLLLVKLGDVRKALMKEPTITHASHRTTKMSLIDDSNPYLEILYEQFDSLKIALADDFSDMLIPAITWLQFIEKD